MPILTLSKVPWLLLIAIWLVIIAGIAKIARPRIDKTAKTPDRINVFLPIFIVSLSVFILVSFLTKNGLTAMRTAIQLKPTEYKRSLFVL